MGGGFMGEIFGNITLFDVFVQLLGFGAMALGIGSYQAKTRRGILFMQLAAAVLWSTQFFFLKSYTGAALNIVSIVRNLVYMQKEKHAWARSKYVPIITAAAFILCGILTWNGIMSIFPTAAMVLSSVSLYVTEERKIRIISLFVSPLWLVYDAWSFSIGGTVSEIFTIISILIAMWRFGKKKTDNI